MHDGAASGTVGQGRTGHVHRHLINLCRIVLLNVAKDTDIIGLDEVDRDTLAAETSRATDPVDVELSVVWQVVADDQRDLCG